MKTKNARSWLRCMECDDVQDILTERRFRCAQPSVQTTEKPDGVCGGLFDVVHDIGSVNPGQLCKIFDSRLRSVDGDLRTESGVWRFKELIAPAVPLDKIVSLGEGLFPLWRAGRNTRAWVGGNLDLRIMPQGLNPTGSFKDMGGTVMMTYAKLMGITTVVCASTGDTSAMAAAYAAAAGIQCIVFLPKGGVTDEQVAQLYHYGAKIVFVPGKFDVCMKIVRELVALGRAFPANSINPTRIEGHQATVFLAAQHLGWKLPNWFVVPVGNGSNASSVGRGIRQVREYGLAHRDHPCRILGAQVATAQPLAASWEKMWQVKNKSEYVWESYYTPGVRTGDTVASAQDIDDPVSAKKVRREVLWNDGAVLAAAEADLTEAMMVAGSDGHGVCPQTGTALAVLRQAVARGFVRTGEQVVLVSTAAGLKFSKLPVALAKGRALEAETCDLEEVAGLAGI